MSYWVKLSRDRWVNLGEIERVAIGRTDTGQTLMTLAGKVDNLRCYDPVDHDSVRKHLDALAEVSERGLAAMESVKAREVKSKDELELHGLSGWMVLATFTHSDIPIGIYNSQAVADMVASKVRLERIIELASRVYDFKKTGDLMNIKVVRILLGDPVAYAFAKAEACKR